MGVVQYENADGAPIVITSAELKKVPADKIAAGGGKRVVVEQIDQGIPPPGESTEKSTPEPMKMRFPETDADGNATVMLVSLLNSSDKQITGYEMGGGGPDQQLFFAFHRGIAPGETFQLAVPVSSELATASDFALKLKGVRFGDGQTWGQFDEQPHVMIRNEN